MILSVLHKFVFIKGFKVGGTSCELALSQLCGPDDIVTPVSPADERGRLGARNYGADPAAAAAWLRDVAAGKAERPPAGTYYNHMPLREVEQHFGSLDGYAVFCLERSPYAKVLSYLNWRLGRFTYSTGGELPHGTRRHLLECFDDNVLRVRNIDRYRDRSGQVRATVWRLPALADSLARLSARVGRPAPVLPHAKRGLVADACDPRNGWPPSTSGSSTTSSPRSSPCSATT